VDRSIMCMHEEKSVRNELVCTPSRKSHSNNIQHSKHALVNFIGGCGQNASALHLTSYKFNHQHSSKAQSHALQKASVYVIITHKVWTVHLFHLPSLKCNLSPCHRTGSLLLFPNGNWRSLDIKYRLIKMPTIITLKIDGTTEFSGPIIY
jgi:hypothetical protein